MIPKKIHYCWFGSGQPDELAQKCIDSWKKYCPDYEIVKWNEDNYDVTKHSYMKEAYEAGKWAFVTDYARLDILYKHGGIYFDTDVEVIRSFDPLLENRAFVGREDGDRVNTGQAIGAEKGLEIIRELRDVYKNEVFKTGNGYNTTTCVDYTSDYLVRKGLKNDNSKQTIDELTVYPRDYFCPIKVGHTRPVLTDNTYSIHHFAASWHKGNKFIKEIKYHVIPIKKGMRKIVESVFGEGTWKKIKAGMGR